MVYEFSICPSIRSQEPVQEYFTSVRDAAARAVIEPGASRLQAEAVCEYLDCVDGADIPLTPELYCQCTALLCGYLRDATTSAAQSLAAKSWAAKTIFELNGCIDTARGKALGRVPLQRVSC